MHIPSSEIGTGYFQETHPEILFKECSHYCELISNPKQFERVLHIAMQSAVGKGGVSVIVLPGDVAGMELHPNGSSRSVVGHRPSIRPWEKELAQLSELINSSKKVALFCGNGSRGTTRLSDGPEESKLCEAGRGDSSWCWSVLSPC